MQSSPMTRHLLNIIIFGLVSLEIMTHQIAIFGGTVWMNEMPRFYVVKLLLHHYRSDLAHLSDFESLVIGMSQSERWAKSN